MANGTTPEVQFEIKGLDITFIAGETLTGHIYKPVYLSAERTVKLMTASDKTQCFVGFLQSGDKNSTVTIVAGDHVSVRVSGFTLVCAQSSFTFGESLKVADSQGRVDTADDNAIVIATAMESASVINHYVTAKIVDCPIKGDNT